MVDVARFPASCIPAMATDQAARPLTSHYSPAPAADPTKESVRVVDVLSGKRLATMGAGGAGGHAGRINAVGWSWDSSRLATGEGLGGCGLGVRVGGRWAG